MASVATAIISAVAIISATAVAVEAVVVIITKHTVHHSILHCAERISAVKFMYLSLVSPYTAIICKI